MGSILTNMLYKQTWIDHIIWRQFNIIYHMITIVEIYHISQLCKYIIWLQLYKYTIYFNCINISSDYYYTKVSDGYNWITYIICLQLYRYIKELQLNILPHGLWLHNYVTWQLLNQIFHTTTFNHYTSNNWYGPSSTYNNCIQHIICYNWL